MAKIRNKNIYPIDVKIIGDEYFIGTDSDGKTLNYPIGSLKDYLSGDILDDNDGGGYENADGTFTWVMYAEDIDGTNMSPIKLVTSNFIGYGFNKEVVTPSSDPLEYIWMPLTFEKGRDGVDGANGIDGLDGTDGIIGPVGLNGNYTYFHVAYANDDAGTDFSQHPFDRKWIGTYSDYTLRDSDNWEDYTWIEVAGIDGTKGIPGINADDGLTYYLHIAYATAADGSQGFDIEESQDKTFIGTFVDLLEDDSLTYSDYSWSRILDPNTGIADGEGTYTWIKYTLIPDGTSPLVDSELEMRYRGFAFKKLVPEESEDYSDYEWHLIYREDYTIIQNNKIRTIEIPEDELESFDAVGLANWVSENVIQVTEDEIVVLESLSSEPEPPEIPTIDTALDLYLANGVATTTAIPLTWNNNGDDAIVKYELYYSRTKDGAIRTEMLPLALVSAYTLSELLDGVVYEIYLLGFDTLGNSKKSNILTVTTIKEYVASTPILEAASITDTEIKVNWSIASVFTADSYELFIDDVKVYDGSNLTYTATGLTPETLYEFKVQAFNGAIASNFSAILELTTIATVDPPLTAPDIFAIKSDFTRLDYSISVLALELPRITNFQLRFRERKITDPFNWTERVLSTETLQSLVNLDEDTTYELQVRTTDGTVVSEWSELLLMTTADREEGVSILLQIKDPLTAQEILDGYRGRLTIIDGVPNSIVGVAIYVSAKRGTVPVSGASVEFKDSVFDPVFIGTVYSLEKIDITLDSNGYYTDVYKVLFEGDSFGVATTVRVNITTSANTILQGTDTEIFIGDSSEFSI